MIRTRTYTHKQMGTVSGVLNHARVQDIVHTSGSVVLV